MTTAPVDLTEMSPECAVATKRGYGDLHAKCRQTADIPLPGASGIFLVKRCRCPHHRGAPAAGSEAS